MAKFNVGDKVKALESSGYWLNENQRNGVVVNVRESAVRTRFSVKLENYPTSLTFFEEELALLDDGKVKPGDTILITNPVTFTGGKYRKGDVLTVEKVESDGDVYVEEHNVVIFPKEFEVVAREIGKDVKVGDTIEVLTDISGKDVGDKSKVGWSVRGQGVMHTGAKGEVIEVKGEGIYAKFDADQPGKSYNYGRFFLLHGEYKVVEEGGKAKKSTFNPGDKVKFELPIIGTKVETLKERAPKFDRDGHGIAWRTEESGGWIGEDQFELYEEAKPKEDAEKQPRFIVFSHVPSFADVTKGKKYEINRTDIDGDYWILDDEGGPQCVMSKNSNFTYEIIEADEDAFKVGDHVEMTSTQGYILRDSQRTGTVVDVHYGRRKLYEIDIDNYTGGPLTFFEENLRALDAEQKLQEGDYVVPLPSADDKYIVTDTGMKLGKVIDTPEPLFGDIRIEVIAHSSDTFVGEDFGVESKHFRKATSAEVDEFLKGKPETFEVGDKVRVSVEGSPRHGWGRVRNGDTGEVVDVTSRKVVVDFPKQSGWNALPSELKKVGEEVEEIDKWAEIGRKPNEFKEGDIVRVLSKYHSNSRNLPGDIGEVVSLNWAGAFVDVVGRNTADANGNHHVVKNLELITPVEQRFDR